MDVHFKQHLKSGVGVLLLREEPCRRLMTDREAFGSGLLVVAGAGLAWALWRLVTVVSWWGLLVHPFGFLVGFLFLSFLVHLAAMALGGTGSFLRLARPLTCSFVAGWALVLPFVGIPLLLWYLVAATLCVRRAHLLSRRKAAAAMAIPLGGILLLLLAAYGTIALTQDLLG